jgi:hypothetical protein
VPWVGALTVLLLLAGLGLWLLLDDSDPTAATDPAGRPAADGPAVDRPDRDSRTPEGRETISAAPAAEPTDLARFASVTAPPAAPPNHDLAGNRVRYDASNLVDDAPDTCWRMPGDGTGKTIVFRFDRPTELHEVALVNGYAKTARAGGRTLDWYRGNRRVLAVSWELDDGTRVDQQLRQTRELQSAGVPRGAPTRTVRLTLLDVSEPGRGPSGRDYTAISEVSLVGVPAH